MAGVDTQVDGDLNAFIKLGRGVGLHQFDGVFDLMGERAIAGPGLDALCSGLVLSLQNLKTNRSGGALDDLGGGLNVVCVEVLHFLRGDVAQLGTADLAGD